ncbi:DUF2933 domain-containing protein [Mesobacillus maritimus]|uniref:DUF2933 domain-containing protein n=1 Tax=Mesobacillus maritimus TaxID=1643336 RepID=UPI00203F56BF|nr:DUF2933 domain-containing protein [Mesobacillus maritimus]MCM3669831.1 DUF2933 domain-containing protein [Mesobacillus maritimus]
MNGKRMIVPMIIVLIIGVTLAGLGKWEWLVWGIFLLCPLIHLFGHNHSGHNHSGNNHSSHNNNKKSSSEQHPH